MIKCCDDCRFCGHYENVIYRRYPHCCCELWWHLFEEEVKVDKNKIWDKCPLIELKKYIKIKE